MNQTQVNNFLECLSQIDDANYAVLHTQALANIRNITGTSISLAHDDDDHDHDHDHDEHDLLVAKGVAMAVMFSATLICGFIPTVLNRCFKWTDNTKNPNSRSSIIIKCLLSFGGGVLLSTTFLHLLPDVQEGVQGLQDCHIIPELSFPLAQLLMCCGFFMMYLIEELIHAYIHRHKRTLKQDENAFERAHSIRNSYLVKGRVNDNNKLNNNNVNDGVGVDNNETRPIDNNDVENPNFEKTIKLELPANDRQIHTHTYKHSHSHSHLVPPPTTEDGGENDTVTSSLRGFCIVLALSLHEIFEGFAIGLGSSASSVWLMFAAVSAHKLVLAFCVGVELIVARTRTALTFVYIMTFAIVSPLGIGIGMLIYNQNQDASSIPSVIIQGLACGTLLYVVFFEILSKNQSGLLVYLFMLIGFGVMFGLQELGSLADSHDHGSSCSGHSHD